MNINFGNKLDAIRKARNLSMQQLANLAGMSQPLICNLINNRRVIGEYAARKLGSALKLDGVALEEFVFCAINNCTEKVLEASKGYPSELLNLVAGELNNLGISPEKIQQCVRRPNNDDDAVLHLTDGKSAFIILEIAIR